MRWQQQQLELRIRWEIVCPAVGHHTRPSIVKDLDKETVRQGVISPSALYIRLYSRSVLIRPTEHQRLFYCMSKIDPTRWTSYIYRLAISCHLFTKLRHLHETDILSDQYLTLNKSLFSSSPHLLFFPFHFLFCDKPRKTDARKQSIKGHGPRTVQQEPDSNMVQAAVGCI